MNDPKKILVGAVVLALIALTYFSTVTATDEETGQRQTAVFLRTFGTFVAAWLTICILSFLYKDNPLYKAAEHVMVGLAMGFFAVTYAFQVIKPRFWDRLVEGDLQEGDVLFGSEVIFRWSLVIPAILGILMLTRIFPKVAWLSRWSIAATIGIGSGLAIPVTIQRDLTTQFKGATMLPINYVEALRAPADTLAADLPGFTNVPLWEIGVPILILGTICGLMYFFFSVPHRGVVGGAASIGIWILMIGFGASFGYTVMARLSLFIGRVLFLLKDWLGVLST